MVRLLIAVVMVLTAGSANAITNETLYGHCKAFSDNGFSGENSRHVACLSYFTGIGEMALNLCMLGKYGGISYDPKSGNASIQHYVNDMKNNTEEWKYGAALRVWVSLAENLGTTP